MEMTKLIGFYGTSLNEARRIAQGQSRLKVTDGRMNKGIYFFSDMPSAVKKAKKGGLISSDVGVLQCEIMVDKRNMLNLSTSDASGVERFRRCRRTFEKVSKITGVNPIFGSYYKYDKYIFKLLCDDPKWEYKIIQVNGSVLKNNLHNLESGALYTTELCVRDPEVVIHIEVVPV